MLVLDEKSAFDDHVNILLDELSLGIRWERPSIILVIYRSEHIKNMIQAVLANSLAESEHTVIDYTVDRLHYDVPLELLNHPQHEHTVFFIHGLRWGGGRGYSNAYRALNMHREYLVEGNIKAVFWLTKYEIKQLTRHSPDFWAFRHKVVEFFDLPAADADRLDVSWIDMIGRNVLNSEDILEWLTNANKYFVLGCYDEAIDNLRKALRAHPDVILLELYIAEIYIRMGQLQITNRILKKIAKMKTGNSEILQILHLLEQKACSFEKTSGGFSTFSIQNSNGANQKTGDE